MMVKKRYRSVFGRFAFFMLIGTFLFACSIKTSPPTPDVQATSTILSLEQTKAALDVTVQAYQAAQTEAARATETPIPSPTPIPSSTPTPGPLVIRDDFSADTGRWTECGQCVVENGSLHMGPYPIAIDGHGYTAICKDCGIVQDYKMGVDAAFIDGYTDRGFGLVLRELDGSYADVEITTWQVYGSWVFNQTRNTWGSLLGGDSPWRLTGNLRPGVANNRLEVEVTSQGGTSTLYIRINGQLVNTTTMPAISGRVGLVVGLHSLGVRFDNFYFEGYPIRQPGNNNDSTQQG